jgi:thioredoxin-related protein
MKILLIVTLLVSTVFAKSYKDFAQKMNYETNYEIALQKAKKEKKDIMFFLIANFCPWCIKFEKKVLSKKKIDAIIQKKYIPLIINREEKNFPNVFNSAVVPTIHFVDYKSAKIKKTIIGYNKKSEFIDIITK